MNDRFLTVVRNLLLVLVALAGLGFTAYAVTSASISGSKMLMALAVAAAVVPALIFPALKRPIIFPFCLFVALIPFDALLSLTSAGTLTRLLAAVAGAALIFWLIRHKTVSSPSTTLFAWLALFLWMVCTIFWAIDPTVAIGRISTIAQLLVLYAAVSLTPIRIGELKAVLMACIAGGVAAAAYGAYYFYHVSLYTTEQRLELSNGQDYIDPNHFAAALILPITIVTVLALSSRSALLKIFLLILDLVLFGGMFAAGSRGGFVAIAVVFAYLIWASRWRLQIGVVALIVIGASFLMPVSIWSRFSDAISSGGSGRTDIWHVGFTAFKHFWLVGAGLGNFPIAYNTAYIHAFQQIPQGWSRVSHNLIVSLATELGTIGLLLLLFACANQYLMVKKIRTNSSLYDYKLIAQGALLGLLTDALFLDVIYEKYAWLVFMVGALTYSAWKAAERQATGSSLATSDRICVSLRRPLPLAMEPRPKQEVK